MKIATVTSYVEQLCTPTPEYRKAELSAIERTLHAPHNALPKYAAARLDMARMRKIPVLELRAQAAQYRVCDENVHLLALRAKHLDHREAAIRAYGEPECNQQF